MENLRKIKQLSDRQAQKKYAMTEMMIRKSTLKTDHRQSILNQEPEEGLILIKNLDSNKIEMYSRETLQQQLLGGINSLPEIQQILERIYEKYLTDLEKEEEQFLEACYQGDLYAVRKVIEGNNKHPIDPRTAVTDEGKNGIHLATVSGAYRNTQIIRVLKDYGVDVNGKTKHEERTPLMLGCILGNEVAIQALIDLSANTHLQDHEGNTAMHFACIYQQEKITRLLLKCQAPTTIKNNRGLLPIQCIPKNSDGILELLSENEEIKSSSAGETQSSLQKNQSNQEKVKHIAITELHEITLSNFKKLSLLGRGAFGEVYLVKNISDGQQYAMKVLDKMSIMRQNILRYAMTERQILSTINHPFIVKLQYAFQTADKLCLVMDYCPGGDLLCLIKKNGTLNQNLLKMYVAEIVLAIEALHRAEIIYRDLKPSNIIIDGQGHACLTDFGLSKQAAIAHSFCGSTAYLAPEMLWRRGHTKVLDWYLLGVLIYEGLTGRPPFWDSNKEQLLANIKRGQYKHLSSNFSPEVRDLIEKLLKSNSSKRLGINGSKQIKVHPWFKQIDWKVVENRGQKLPAPDQVKGKAIKQEVFEDLQSAAESEKVNGWDYIPKNK